MTMRMMAGALAGVALAAAGAGSARAQVIYQTGFEDFATGALAGQQGWNVFGTGAAVSVQDTVAASGSQAVRVDGSLVGGQTGPWRANPTPIDQISLSADIMLTSSSEQRAWQFAGLGAGLIGFAGGVNIGSTGNITAITATPMVGVLGTFSRGAFHRLELVLNYATQTFGVNLDGNSLATGLAFCGANFSCPATMIPEYRTALFDTFGTGGNDVGYLDNVRIAAVPEPGAWALLIAGFGAAGAMLRRRRTIAAA